MLCFPKDYETHDRVEELRIRAQELRQQGRGDEAQRLDDHADSLEEE
jgi:hypothetical protein